MPDAREFHAYGASHIAVLLLTALITALLVWRVRGAPERGRSIDQTLAVLLIGYQVAFRIISWRMDLMTRDNALPLHLCDIACLCGAVALLRRSTLLAELTWFWGLSGTLNGLLTPDLHYDFPNLAFVAFFLLHCLVVITAVYLVAGRGHTPRPGAVWRAFGWSQVYLGGVSLINWLIGTNYGYTCAKPPVASLLDVLGPWPWYLLSLQAIALTYFTLLYLPFVRRNRTTRA